MACLPAPDLAVLTLSVYSWRMTTHTSTHHYPDTWQVDIAGNVRAEVARRRIPQSDIAAALGEIQQWVSRRMSGSVEWRISELVAIAELLGIHPAVLMGGRPPAQPGGGEWAPRGSNPEPTVSGVHRRHLAVAA